MNDLELIPRPKHVSLTIFAQAEHLAVGCPGRGSEGAARQSLRRQMSEVGLAYLGCLAAATSRETLGLGTVGLLMLSGPITTVPLLFFGAAARRLRLSTLGILQYLSPTLQFLLAVVAFGGPFSSAQLLSFGCIWAAVLLYAFDSLRATRSSPVPVLEPD